MRTKETIKKLFTVSEKDVNKFNEDVSRYMTIRNNLQNEKNELSASIEYEDNMTPEEILKNFENEVHMIIYFEERISFFENNCMYLQKRLEKFSDEVRDFCEDLFSSNNNLTSKLH